MGPYKITMMNEDKDIEARLWNYIDGNTGPEEALIVKSRLQTNAKWQSIYNQLLQLHLIMKEDLEMEEPSMRFTENIMDEIAGLQIAPATKNYFNKRIIFSIAAFFMMLIAGLLIYSITQVNGPVTNNGGSSFEWVKRDPGKYFGPQTINIFIMVNTMLGLILLDRFLTRKHNPLKQSTQNS